MRHLGFVALLVLLVSCGDAPRTSKPGDPCSSAAPCLDGLTCISDERFPGGYCTSTCDTGCPAETLCDSAYGIDLCLATCVPGAEPCRDGYQCWRSTCRPPCSMDTECGESASCSAGVCEGPECVSATDCGAGLTCRLGSCVEGPPDGAVLLPTEAPCSSHAECEGGICLAPELGGFCSVACADVNDCFVFSVASACTALPTDTNGDGTPDSAPSVCAPIPTPSLSMGRSCGSDSECDGRLCQQGQCTEVCDDDADCLPGMICATLPRAGVAGVTYRGCGYAGTGPSVERVDLGSIEVRPGFPTDLRVATPPDAVSLTLQAEHGGGPMRTLTFFEVFDPSDELIFDLSELFAFRDQPIRWLPIDTEEDMTMLIPNTSPDRVTFVPGLHRFSVSAIQAMGDPTPVQMQVSAWVKRSPGGVVSSGTLNLNVHLVGVGVSAATAPSNAKLQGALTRLRSILSSTGITLGSVSYFDITGAAESTYRVIDTSEGPTSELANLFRLSAPRSGRTLNIFLVRSISTGSGGFQSLGIAGGIPGPVGIHGTMNSGVVCSFADGVVGSGTTGANLVGHILSHEISHYLGLYHSTERTRPCGAGEDPTTATCAPYGGGDTLADTTRGDMTNLMYWSVVGSGSNTRLSNGQGHTLRMSAMVDP